MILIEMDKLDKHYNWIFSNEIFRRKYNNRRAQGYLIIQPDDLVIGNISVECMPILTDIRGSQIRKFTAKLNVK